MKRERVAWALSLVLLSILALHLSPTLARRDTDYSFVRTYVDIHRQVSANYVEDVDETKLQQGAIEGMLTQLDPYSVYVPPAKKEEFDRMLEGTFKGVGVQLNQRADGRIEVVTPIDGSPAYRAGVKVGDIILKVNGESLEGTDLSGVIKKIGGELGTTVKLTVLHATGNEEELAMKRDEIVVPTLKGYQRKANDDWDWYVCEDPKIAYLRLTQFTPTSSEAIKSTLTKLLADGMKGMILDLRFNPGGQLDQAVQIVDLLIEKGTIVVTKGRNRPEDIKVAHKEGTLPYFPMIVLVNEHSASASEIVAGSLQDNKRAIVVGTRSYGKGSVQELIPLDGNNGELKLTVAYYYLPSGRLVHKKKDAKDWGVEPQIVVPMDEEQQKKMQQARLDLESFHRPTTKPASKPVAAAPATQPVDTQLQRAVDTLIAAVIFQDNRPHPEGAPPVARTQPTTQP